MNLINKNNLKIVGYSTVGALTGGLIGNVTNQQYMNSNMLPNEQKLIKNKAEAFNREAERYTNSPETRIQYQDQFNNSGEDFVTEYQTMQEKYQNPISKYLPVIGGVVGASSPLIINKLRR